MAIESNRRGAARWLWPLQSRKVQVALATLVVSFAAQAGWILNEDSVTNVLAIGVALILGIAHEDAGAKSALNSTPGSRAAG